MAVTNVLNIILRENILKFIFPFNDLSLLLNQEKLIESENVSTLWQILRISSINYCFMLN